MGSGQAARTVARSSGTRLPAARCPASAYLLAALSTSAAPRIPDTTATPLPPAPRMMGTSSGRHAPNRQYRCGAGGPQQASESLHPQPGPGVILGRGRAPGTDAPVVRICGGTRLALAPYRRADDEAGRRDPPSQGHRQIVGSEVNAGGTGGHGHVGPIVYQHRNPERPHQGAHHLGQLPGGGLLQTQLHRASPRPAPPTAPARRDRVPRPSGRR